MSSDPSRSARWTDTVFLAPRRALDAGRRTIGVLPGEGIGPEVTSAALTVLAAVSAGSGAPRLDVPTGGAIGHDAELASGRADAELASGRALTEEVARFCAQTFAAGAAVL